MKGTTETRGRIRIVAGLAAFVALASGCIVTAPRPVPGPPPPPPWRQLQRNVLDQGSHAVFLKKGPYKHKRFLNYRISLNPSEKIKTDYYMAESGKDAPLAIIMHGNRYSKLAHRLQGRHLASWGIHALLINLPNQHQWIENGHTLKNIARLIHSSPSILSQDINRNAIILVGHSFGASASAIAASGSSPAAAAILLDPALVHPLILGYLKRIQRPVLILGADKKVFRAKRRWQFFRYAGGPVAEFSITGATHTDAQLPGINQVRWGFDWETTYKIQKQFLAFITAGLYGLAGTGQLDHTWSLYHGARAAGRVKEGRVRFAATAKAAASLGYPSFP